MIPKVKVFMWRLVLNIIPSARNLRAKGIQLNNNYYVCGSSGESSYHIMFECSLSRSVWNAIYSNLSGNVQRNACSDNFWQDMIEMKREMGLLKYAW